MAFRGAGRPILERITYTVPFSSIKKAPDAAPKIFFPASPQIKIGSRHWSAVITYRGDALRIIAFKALLNFLPFSGPRKFVTHTNVT